MIRLRCLLVSNEDAAAIARYLELDGAGVEKARRIERAIDAGGGLITADRRESETILRAISAMCVDDPDATYRLEELISRLRNYIESPESGFGHAAA
jgi:hypothetical protein